MQQQQYQLFPVWGYVLVGLVLGQEELVLGHKNFENVALVVTISHGKHSKHGKHEKHDTW